MVEPINLRQLRKQKKRESEQRQAEENRQFFGRTKAEKNYAARHKKQNDLAHHSLTGKVLSLTQPVLKDDDA